MAMLPYALAGRSSRNTNIGVAGGSVPVILRLPVRLSGASRCNGLH